MFARQSVPQMTTICQTMTATTAASICLDKSHIVRLYPMSILVTKEFCFIVNYRQLRMR